MKKSPTFTRASLLLVFMSFTTLIFAQECAVDHEYLKGTYSGDCKKGKANGKGKATGIDSYEGDFKSGLPDGQGTYTWQNGTVYTGKYSKGLREGKGMMTFKRVNGGADSVVEGFWKKDTYIGRYEKPWIVHSRTASVSKVEVEYTADKVNRVKIIITNTTGGVKGASGFEMAQYKLDNVQLIKGYYERITNLETHYKSTESSLMEVAYPLRVKLNMTREEVEVELLEPGSYKISISINQ